MGGPSKPKVLNILFTCVGRRIELLNAFRRAGKALRQSLTIHGADRDLMVPGQFHVDKAHQLPPLKHKNYSQALTALIKQQKIHLVIPLNDLELPQLARLAPQLEKLGCTALISAPGVIAICRDKIKTYQHLSGAGIDTPATWPWQEVAKMKRHKFPYFLKPRFGSASVGNHVVSNKGELLLYGQQVKEAIVQEMIVGDEFTLDVYTGFDGKPRCVVPRKRLEVRSGEVSKALIVKHPKIMAIGKRVAESFGECRGVVTVQCMVTKRNKIRVIEINPRFGGGVPLAIHAGADFPKWILMELLGRKPRISATGFRDDVAMLRFDDSVFVPQASKKMKRPGQS